MPLSKSAKFYRDNPDSRRKKQAYDKRLNSRPSQVNKREESNKMRARAKRRGTDVRGKDWDHHTRSLQPIKTNRGRVGEGGRKIKFGRQKS